MTTGTFLNGRVKISQTTDGYRFSIDAVLLAAAVRPRPGDVVMDMGTGCGIIPILLACRNPKVRIIGVELQEELARLARRNVAANHMQDQIEVLHQDARSLENEMIHRPVDWIVSNPPYRPADSGRINPNAERAAARHEIHLSLKELVQVCPRFLQIGGRLSLIYPVERLVDLFTEMRSVGIEPKWMQCIHSRPGDGAKLALVQGRMLGNAGLTVARPLYIYTSDGRYTQAVQQMMTP